ncbi:MAG: hypothetical protein ABR527_09900 [Gemmatimonadota bacterium]
MAGGRAVTAGRTLLAWIVIPIALGGCEGRGGAPGAKTPDSATLAVDAISSDTAAPAVDATPSETAAPVTGATRPDAAASGGVSTPPDTAGWTADIVDRPRPSAPPATLVDVRAARHSGFDRVAFEFAEPALPGIHVEYVDRPVRDCGAGQVVPIAGDAWLAVRFYPANAHDERGQPTAGPREHMPGLPIVREVERTCDFEAVVEYVLGAASPNRYRVLELANPARIVVDVRHGSR